MGNKNVLILIVIVAVALTGLIFFANFFKQDITNFEECIAAGNPAMESYPRQCIDSRAGKTFVEEIPDAWRLDGIGLMQHETEGSYGCFGCGKTICIDPIPEMKSILETKERYCNSDFKIVENGNVVEENVEFEEVTEESQLKVSWGYNNIEWVSQGDPPSCSEPLVLQLPVDINLATSILYPGQIRGGDFKPHGGFRFDNNLVDDITVTIPLDAYLVDGGRYLVGGEIQYTLDFINSCGIMYRFGHLLELTPKFAQVAETFPAAKEGDSRTYGINPPIFVETGEVVATAVGFRETSNVAVDFGVYDLRQKNDASKNPGWSEKYGGSQGSYAVCWLDLLPTEDSIIVKALPGADGEKGKQSDYC